MKCTIPEISWHNRDPVLSLDLQPNPPDGIYRLATAGTDSHVLIWQLRVLDNGGVSVEALSDLTRHNRAVNAVRFSPDGQLLASVDDEAAVIIWRRQDSSAGGGDLFLEEGEQENKEHWTVWKMLRGHLEDVYDLAWSSCSHFLVTGSVDNTAILWDVHKGKNIGLLKDHKGFVQGVSWDPQGQYVATLSSDRNCRIFNITTKRIAYRMHKTSLPVLDKDQNVTEKSTRLFYDDTLKSFCRRLSFSPDGEVLVAPSGIVEQEDGTFTNVCYVFSRYCLTKPILYLPTKDKYTLAVRFCPQLFELRPLLRPQEEGEKEEVLETWQKYDNLLNLPYRMVFAVATQNAVLLYDTQQPVPFARLSNIHYTRLSDVAWSCDGRLLVVSSTDGYCSLVSFSEGELGTPYKKEGDESTPDEKVKKPAEESRTEAASAESAAPLPMDVDDKRESRVAGMVSAGKDEGSAEEIKQKKTDKPSPAAQSISQIQQRDKSPRKVEEVAKPAPLTVRRASDGGKSVRRIAFTTLSGPTLSSEDKGKCKSAVPEPHKDTKEKGESENHSKEIVNGQDNNQDYESPSKRPDDTSPSKQSAGGGRTPRRVQLITLSSPKGKKLSDSEST